jgi:FkbM family methyltransferase
MILFINSIIGIIASILKSVMPVFVYRLPLLVLRASLGDYVVSVYNVKLLKNWNDATFRYCVSGLYGFYLSSFLERYGKDFSFLDIGANQGLYSLIALRNKNVKRVYAFEPNPFVRELLIANCRLNNASIDIYADAISSQNGTQQFFFDTRHSGVGSIIGKGNNKIDISVRDYTVFDEIEDQDGFNKIVKIDVEGFEPVVLAALLKSVISKSIKYIFFEADENVYDVKVACENLVKHGFKQIYKDGSGMHYNLMFENSN